MLAPNFFVDPTPTTETRKTSTRFGSQPVRPTCSLSPARTHCRQSRLLYNATRASESRPCRARKIRVARVCGGTQVATFLAMAVSPDCVVVHVVVASAARRSLWFPGVGTETWS